MRIIIFCLFFLCLLSSAKAQTIDSLIVKLRNGTEVAIALSNIENITFDSVTSAVREFPLLPNRVTIVRNFPNPAIAATKIEFDVSTPCPVEVEIYNIHGDNIRRLHKSNCEVGPNSLNWDGLDGVGTNVPSGTYFYRLSLGSDTRAGKLIISR